VNVQSVILDKGESSYTDMEKIFRVIENEQTKYNWLITNCECYTENEQIDELFSKEYLWISGEELTEVIAKVNIQFIWGVFSGFPKEITLEEVLKHDLSFADGFRQYWVDNVIVQHPLADIEIVAWDSSLTLFISKDDELVEKFRRGFPLSEDLSARNTRNNSEIAHIEELLKKELVKRNIDANENILHKKYLIWNKLYSTREKVIKDGNILQLINEMLDQK
jgi:hypothetical protein